MSALASNFWEAEKKLLQEHFSADRAAEGICKAVQLIGARLREHFPTDENDEDNELPDEIIYG